jgi:hypothetical protein
MKTNDKNRSPWQNLDQTGRTRRKRISRTNIERRESRPKPVAIAPPPLSKKKYVVYNPEIVAKEPVTVRVATPILPPENEADLPVNQRRSAPSFVYDENKKLIVTDITRPKVRLPDDPNGGLYHDDLMYKNPMAVFIKFIAKVIAAIAIISGGTFLLLNYFQSDKGAPEVDSTTPVAKKIEPTKPPAVDADPTPIKKDVASISPVIPKSKPKPKRVSRNGQPKFMRQGKGWKIELPLRASRVKHFTLKKPSRLVIDFYKAKSFNKRVSLKSPIPPISKVRTAKRGKTVRYVFEFKGRKVPKYKVRFRKNKTIIRIN